jgi:putative transposase
MRELDFATAKSLPKGFLDVYPAFREELERQAQAQVEEFLNRTLVLEAELQLQAKRYERSEDRIDYRAGYRTRTVITRKGTFTLRVPKARSTPLVFSVFDRYQRLWKEVHTLLREIFLAGCSTRRTGEVLRLLLGTRVSAQTVSRALQALTPLVEAFHQRPLQDRYRYLFLDGLTHVLRGHRRKKIVLVAYGITEAGVREILDFQVVPSESHPAWFGFLNRLFHRGLTGEKIRVIVSDGSTGLETALQEIYPQAEHQICWAHKLRNVADKVRKNDQRKVLAGARRIYLAADRKKALRAFRRWKERWIALYPAAVRSIERVLDQLLAFFHQPKTLWKTLRTTNLIERSFVEVRRRTRPIGSFADPKSLERITYALTIYLNQKWERIPLKEFAQMS